MDDPYKFITTEDLTLSLYMREYDQAMHSISGAYQEALLKHVRPSGVCRIPSGNVFVLDVGFGIGYNVLALLTEYSGSPASGHLTVVSLEKDKNLLPFMEMISFQDARDDYYSAIKTSYRTGEYDSKRLTLMVMTGDARTSIRRLGSFSFNAVFHDPFSPARNPELWTIDFFKKVHALMEPGALLTTYSSARHIRRALLEAGFSIGSGPSVGKKREGTIASKGPFPGMLPRERIDELMSDHRSTPYRDQLLSLGRDDILENRIAEMRTRKGPPAP